MGNEQVSPVLRYIRQIALCGSTGHGTDAQLLRRFTAEGDEAAFRAMLQRHGPMVLGVCRRLLRQAEDAEDAFQATFLILVRRANSIGRPEALGNWLYGVAYRTASKARSQAAKRRAREGRAIERRSAESLDPVLWDDLRPVLDEEIRRLPAHYRAPFVLCYLEGRTNREAAQALGCPEGTVLSRLAWARERLRTRLTRRGLAPALGALATGLSVEAASAAMPGPLLDGTAKAALLLGPGQAVAAGLVSSRVASLMGEVSRAMWMSKAIVAMGAVLAICLIGTGSAALLYQAPAGETAQLKHAGALAQPSGRAAGPGQNHTEEASRKDKQALQGTWVPLSVRRGWVPDMAKDRLAIKGDRMTVNPGEEHQAWAYQLEPGKQPKAITLTPLEGPAKGKTFPGIYSLDGDYLEICYSDRAGSRRPNAFVTTPGVGGNRLHLLKRKSASNENAARDLSRYQLKDIALAMHGYHNAHGKFPPAAVFSQDGQPLLSWHVALLPYIYQQNLYNLVRLDKRWDNADNSTVAQSQIRTYWPAIDVRGRDWRKTYYQVFVGKGTVFEGKKGIRMKDITDGLSSTILVVEGGEPVPWTEPAALLYAANKPLPKLGGMFKDGFHVLLADGSIRFVKKKFNEKVLRRAITRNDGQRLNVDDLSR